MCVETAGALLIIINITILLLLPSMILIEFGVYRLKYVTRLTKLALNFFLLCNNIAIMKFFETSLRPPRG